VELVQSGALGTIREVYNWCNTVWTGARFTTGETPAHLDWDLWLGPAKQRPYSPGVHPRDWRKFWEYGGGTFSDMASHIMDLPFWALGLRHPTSVATEGPPVDPISAPSGAMARYEFPAQGGRPPLKFHWSDGGKHFDLVQKTRDHSGQSLGTWGLGILFVGDKGMLAADYNRHQLLPREKFEGFRPPAPSIPESIGHWNEWVQACKTGTPTTCNFGYAGALTETLLLGIVAYRCGEPLQWDARNLKATNTSKADAYLRKEYRQGWEVAGLRT
jgi:predicted dehydrogenase